LANLNKLRAAIYDHKWLRVLLLPVLKMRNFWGSRRLASRYRVLDLLSVCLVEDPVIKLPEFPGKYAIGPQSDIFKRITIFGVYEPEMVEICRANIDQTRDIIDVGANIGLYTVLFATLAPTRKVLAIEPTAGALTRLRKNISMNGVADRVQIFEGVASDQIGQSQINVVLGREEYSTVGAMEHPALGPVSITTAPTTASTVDTLVNLYGLEVGFIKIDVEGTEHLVIRGMMKTLRKYRPIVLAELCEPLLLRNGSSAREVVSMMESLGYTVRTMIGEMLCIPTDSAGST
jgi:FkbM family methyltransferase